MSVTYAEMAAEMESDLIGKRDMRDRRAAECAKGKWPAHDVEQKNRRIVVFEEIARRLRKAAEAERAKGEAA